MKATCALILSIILLSGCKKEENKVVEYKVYCDQCSVFYKNSLEDMDARAVTGSWNFTFNGRTGQQLQVRVVNTNAGQIIAEVHARGELFDRGYAGGPNAEVTVGGSMP